MFCAILLALLSNKVSATAYKPELEKLGETCDPEAIYIQYYKDDQCQDFDDKMTEKYGRVQDTLFYQWKQKCNNIILPDNLKESTFQSYMIQCTKYGLFEIFYKNDNCVFNESSYTYVRNETISDAVARNLTK